MSITCIMRGLMKKVHKRFLYPAAAGVFLLGVYFVIAPVNSPPFPSLKHDARSTLLKQLQQDRVPRRTDDISEKQNDSAKLVKDTFFSETVQETQSVLDPRKRYLVIGFAGQLGNVLFEFATAYCIAKINNLILVVNQVPQLEELNYRGIIVRSGFNKALAKLRIKHHIAAACCKHKLEMMTLNTATHSHYLHGYFQSWKYFEPCKPEMRDADLFRDNITKKAVSIVTNLRKKQPQRTLVAVHVRMEDYLNKRAVKNGKKVAPPEYFRRAMMYFRFTYRDVIFVVIASDTAWFRKEVTNASDVVVMTRSASPAVDMEVLSRMDHVIISVGTFGWWLAYRNTGTVIYYKDFYVSASRYGVQMSANDTDFVYPGWIPL
ncbi:hypothetical protein ACOMHN_032690 [Nucella lapillus]